MVVMHFMEETLQQITEDILLLENPVVEKEEAADLLQNDISQTLAAVLLWLQTAMESEALAGNQLLELAETNLKSSVKKLVRLHYSLLE